jgi:hypothetical protein
MDYFAGLDMSRTNRSSQIKSGLFVLSLTIALHKSASQAS